MPLKKKPELLITQEEFTIDLTLNKFSGLLLSDFVEKIVRPYYGGNLNNALQDLITKTLSEQEFVHAHITHIKTR